MKTQKDFSTWNSDDLSYWLGSINLSRYSNNILSNNVTGYDLCYLTNEDFKMLGISNIHDKNVLIKQIRLQTLEQLKLKFVFDKKEAIVQLDFDSNFSVFELENFLKEIFQINHPIHLSTEGNEMLCPNIKIIELILLNPNKYKRLNIVKGIPTFSPALGLKGNNKDEKINLYDEIPKLNNYSAKSTSNEFNVVNNISNNLLSMGLTKGYNQRGYGNNLNQGSSLTTSSYDENVGNQNNSTNYKLGKHSENRKHDEGNRKYDEVNRKYEEGGRKYDEGNRKYDERSGKYDEVNRKYDDDKNDNYSKYDNSKFANEKNNYDEREEDEGPIYNGSNETTNENMLVNSTPKKNFIGDKRLFRNSSALMAKPGMALDINYNRKYNIDYQNNTPNQYSKNEGLNYEYKQDNDYTPNYKNNSRDWRYEDK